MCGSELLVMLLPALETVHCFEGTLEANRSAAELKVEEFLFGGSSLANYLSANVSNVDFAFPPHLKVWPWN